MCNRCRDHGFYGGQLSGVFAGPWKWCNCLHGLERRNSEPGLVDEANKAREALLEAADRAKGIRKPRPSVVAEESYSGEF